MRSSILIEPVVTEKTNVQRDANKYVFRVDYRVNKLQVLAAVRSTFGVNPIKCNIMNVSGKPKRLRYHVGTRSNWKKATITLPVGESIQIFEGA